MSQGHNGVCSIILLPRETYRDRRQSWSRWGDAMSFKWIQHFFLPMESIAFVQPPWSIHLLVMDLVFFASQMCIPSSISSKPTLTNHSLSSSQCIVWLASSTGNATCCVVHSLDSNHRPSRPVDINKLYLLDKLYLGLFVPSTFLWWGPV